MRYYIQIHEDGARLPTGDPRGYATLEEAKAAALRHVDDALPHNTVHVVQDVGHAYLGGDGDNYWHTPG